VTRLSFADASFDFPLSFDVLEHVPEYRTALREFYRVLRPGGQLLLSVPFRPDAAETLTRARMLDDGSIEHLIEPDYREDPLRQDGCLAFYHFGWDLADDVRNAGFIDTFSIFYRSLQLGHRGPAPKFIIGRKQADSRDADGASGKMDPAT
jgi:SAM-dependent methyltransferase